MTELDFDAIRRWNKGECAKSGHTMGQHSSVPGSTYCRQACECWEFTPYIDVDDVIPELIARLEAAESEARWADEYHAKWQAAEARVKVLEAALRGMVGEIPPTDHENDNACAYCGLRYADEIEDFPPEKHEATCAWRIAHEVLKETK